MYCQIPGTRERLIARSTRERSDEHVSSRVNGQSAFNIKGFITHSALERLLASMRAKMFCQSMRTRTRSVARSTHVRSDEHVRSRVNGQIAFCIKRFITNFTFERPIASMRAKMYCQSLGTRTRSVARSTHVRSDEHVSSRVNSQSALLIKRFITNSAFERLLARMYTRVIFQTTL